MTYKPTIIGVLNLSPESNIKDSVATTTDEILARANWLKDSGADIIELGGRSISASSEEVDDQTEQSRLLPAIKLLKAEGFSISIDTWSTSTVIETLKIGVDMINFTGSSLDPDLLQAVSKENVPLVTTYMPTSNAHTLIDGEVCFPKLDQLLKYFHNKIEQGRERGVTRLIIDPNLGILHPDMDKLQKVYMQMQILKWFDELRQLGCPIFVYSPWKSDEVGLFAMASAIVHHKADYIRTHYPNVIYRLIEMHASEAS